MMGTNERETRYAEAVSGVLDVFDTVMNVKAECREVARAVMAVADEEQAELRAEVERLRGEVAHWEHHAWEAGEGFKRAIEDGVRAGSRRRETQARHDALVADLRGLLERWGKAEPVVGYPGYDDAYRDAEQEVRAVLDKHAGE